jgi:hypothetical protein
MSIIIGRIGVCAAISGTTAKTIAPETQQNDSKNAHNTGHAKRPFVAKKTPATKPIDVYPIRTGSESTNARLRSARVSRLTVTFKKDPLDTHGIFRRIDTDTIVCRAHDSDTRPHPKRTQLFKLFSAFQRARRF